MASVPASQIVRVQCSRFAEALTKEELSSICFIYKVPEGEREKRGSAIEVLQYLEERGIIDYSQPEQLVKLMRLVQRERWARETEEMIDAIPHLSSIDSHPSLHYPVEEVTSVKTSLHYPVEEVTSVEAAETDQAKVVLRPRSKVTQIRDKRRKAIRSFSLSREVEQDAPLPQDGRACYNSCDSYRVIMRVLQSPETTAHIAEAVKTTLIEQLTASLSLEDDEGLQDEEEEEESIVNVRKDAGRGAEDVSPFSRKGSTISHKSTRSSGYGSMIFENPPSLLDQTDAPFILFDRVEEEITDTSSSTTTSPTRPESDSFLGPFLAPPMAPSRQSSTEDYFTAPSEDESREDTAVVSKSPLSPCHDSTDQDRDHAFLPQVYLRDTGRNIVNSPPLHGREVLIGSMELKMKELMEDIKGQDTQKVYTSYPFPFLSHGQQFQLHFYPNNADSSHCILHLIMLHPPSHPSPSHLSAQVCIYEGGLENVPADALPSSPIHKTTKMVDHSPTPSQADAHSMTPFPNLLSHRELAQIQHDTLVIKAVLEHRITSS